MAVDRSNWPFMVRIAMWGLPNRAAASAFLWLSIAIAVACIALGFADSRFFIGGLMVLASLWYYLSIRWVDRNSSWA
jgi:hypothetical protein